MTTGDKIANFRKQNHYTQEQLAQLLGVSRQSVSKYESNLAYPETEKLIRLSELFGCTVDELLRERPAGEEAAAMEESFVAREPVEAVQSVHTASAAFPELFLGLHFRERKSEKTLWGLPLWHIGKNARGIVAVGLKATGILSVGFVSTGVVSFGLLSLGLFAIGLLAVGLMAAGTLALGLVAAGAISVGLVAMGAVSVGHFSLGAAAIGRYFARGDYAQAMFAAGKTTAHGSVMSFLAGQSPEDIAMVTEAMGQHFPKVYHWLIPILAKLL